MRGRLYSSYVRSSMLHGSVCVQENKRSDLGEQLQRAKHSVTTYTSAIEHMKAQRDATLTDIDHCQLGLDVCSAAVTLLLSIV